MARLLESDVKDLLARQDVVVPRSFVATTPELARRWAVELGDACVVKALVPTGRRGKSGAVRFCDTPDAAAAAAKALLGSRVGPYTVDAVLVEAWLAIDRELYLAVEVAHGRPAYVLLLSGAGGIEIESNQGSITTVELDPLQLPDPDECAQLWSHVDPALPKNHLGVVTAKAVRTFVDFDLTLLEINPLAIADGGEVICAGALAAVDDNALSRHPDLGRVAIQGADRAWRPETALEARVAAITADRSQRGSARYLELEGGNIGFLCGGGGASLLLFDALGAAGGRPANYAEFGGNPTEQRVYDLTRVVLDKPGVEGLFVAHNLTNNTQVDIVAAGVTRALRDAAPEDPFPCVARECGLNDEDARATFESAGVRYFGEETSLNRAAQAMVAAMRQAGRS